MKRRLMLLMLCASLFTVQPIHASQLPVAREQSTMQLLDNIDQHSAQMTDADVDSTLRAMQPSAFQSWCQRIGAYMLFKYFDFCDCCEDYWGAVKEYLRRKKQEDDTQE